MSPRSAFWSIMVLTLLTLLASIIASGSVLLTDWQHVLPLVLLVRGLGLDMAGMIRLSDALRDLHNAREELARKAMMEERLRMARDLHDLLGHSLSMITLKSELAGRLIEVDPARAAREINDVEREVRKALREVRQAVGGYRQQSLMEELDNARQILEAGGITCTIDPPPTGLPHKLDTVLAWAVREGVTNVIRHSRARTCKIRFLDRNTTIRFEVTNDGYNGPQQVDILSGSGLTGLSERVTAQGGKLVAAPVSLEEYTGFRLMVDLPVNSLGGVDQV
jgi:two-component system sensor histidine kinase DesK